MTAMKSWSYGVHVLNNLTAFSVKKIAGNKVTRKAAKKTVDLDLNELIVLIAPTRQSLKSQISLNHKSA